MVFVEKSRPWTRMPTELPSAAAVCVLASGCSTLEGFRSPEPPPLGGRRKGVLTSDGAQPTPIGLLDYCDRSEACGEPELQPAARASFNAATESLGAEHMDRNASASFSRMIMAAAAGSGGPKPRIEERLTKRRWRQLDQMNRFVNRAIAPRSDADLYGVDERWATPISDAIQSRIRPQGDCEDYALEKRNRLIASGWSPEAISLAIARLSDGRFHTVVIAQTDAGDFVLDNLSARIVPLESSQYVWVSRQTGDDLKAWTSTRVALLDPYQKVAALLPTP